MGVYLDQIVQIRHVQMLENALETVNINVGGLEWAWLDLQFFGWRIETFGMSSLWITFLYAEHCDNQAQITIAERPKNEQNLSNVEIFKQ